jgi:hypothetical protein
MHMPAKKSYDDIHRRFEEIFNRLGYIGEEIEKYPEFKDEEILSAFCIHSGGRKR